MTLNCYLSNPAQTTLMELPSPVVLLTLALVFKETAYVTLFQS